ncbi:MAG: molybdenum cofactor biosynthesis protein MoaE [Acidimicrobiia bacterium]|nr:molybdenum cofactor biosynthesis protein MoaE [Acidimicrobiia bacterium]
MLGHDAIVWPVDPLVDGEAEIPDIRVSADPIDAQTLVGSVSTPQSGGIASFLGTVRDHAPGRTGVTHLEYEAYTDHVERVILEVVGEAQERWPVHRIAAHHRVGSLSVGEVAVGVAVSAAHRDEAFAAARFVIDELKARAPIWKKEHWDGGAEWVEGA